MAFTGIPAEAFDFYTALTADNSKAFWTDHKGDYERFVREPVAALGAQLEPEFGPVKLYRPYRDVRFSKDKTPYKDHQGLFAEYRNGLGWYLQVSATGLMLAGGWYMATTGQVSSFREYVAEDDTGTLESIMEDLAGKGYLVDGDRLKSRPRGYDADHPRLDILRYKSMHVTRTWPPEPWMGAPDMIDEVRATWSDYRPLIVVLADIVGPPSAA